MRPFVLEQSHHQGDNYDALRHLVSTYAGQVKLIYIDPPYNTGRKIFVYNDTYFDATNRYRHSTWLEFMYQRLRLAKDLLADDGVISCRLTTTSYSIWACDEQGVRKLHS